MRTGSFQYQNQRRDITSLCLYGTDTVCGVHRSMLPAQMIYSVQTKHAFWKTSRIPWLHGVFETGDTLWFIFVWKDLIAFYVLILLTEWHTEASATSTEAFQHPAAPLRLYQNHVLSSRKLNSMTFPPCHCLERCGFSLLSDYTTHWSCGNVHCNV